LSIVDQSGLTWRKSSRSGGGNNDNCVEVAFTEATVWRKSSRSGGGSNGNCVEVAFAGTAVAVRDSKNPAVGALAFPESSWKAFLGTVAV
jgi:hypothetical protein